MNELPIEPSRPDVERAGGQVGASVAAILRNQHASGAFVASPDFGQYAYCWLRDGAFTAYSLDCAGELDAAERFHRWCARAIDGATPLISAATAARSDGGPLSLAKMPPARFSLEGEVVHDDWPNFQVDGYGTWLWSLHQHLQKGNRALSSVLAPTVEVSARYLATVGTSACFDVWEEDGGSVHTATLACVYGGLVAAAGMLADPGLAEVAQALRKPVLEQGCHDGYFRKSDHSREVDAALLWLCEPFHVVPPTEPALVETVRRISTGLDLGGGIRRYPADIYYGGGAWPVLTASLGWYHLVNGDVPAALAHRDWVAGHVDEQGRLAEQFGGETRDPDHYREWVSRWGPPAADLVWSHAMYVVLATELEQRTGPGQHAGYGTRSNNQS